MDRYGLGAGLAALLDEEDARGEPPFSRLGPHQARASLGAVVRRWWGPVEPVGWVEEITLPAPMGPIRARVYDPGTPAPRAGVVFLHGGGWVLGDLDTHDGPCRALCNRAGAVVVSVEYSKAPEHPFPAGLDDAWAALGWVVANAASLGLRPDRILVAGESAGANLAAVVAVRARDAELALCAQVLVYPVTNADLGSESYERYGNGYGLTVADMRWFLDQYAAGQDRFQPEISPLRATRLHGVCAAYVVTCEFDPLRDDGVRYVDRLRRARVPVVHDHLADAIHGVFLMNGVTPVTAGLIDRMAAYVGGSRDVARREAGHELEEGDAIEVGHRPVVDDPPKS